MNYIDELHTLVQDLRLHITQEYPNLPPHPTPQKAVVKTPVSLPAAKPQYDSFKIKEPIVQAIAAKETPIKALPIKPKAKEADIPKSPMEPVMQALCRPFTKPAQISLLDCIERLQKLGVSTIDAPILSTEAQTTELVVVSFFSPGSDEEKFIQKVAESINNRLGPCSVYLQPGLSAAAECFTLAASCTAKAIVLGYAQEDSPKLAQWLAYFGDDVKESHLQLTQLASKRALFKVELFDLVISRSSIDDVAFKRALWNDLQSILCQ